MDYRLAIQKAIYAALSGDATLMGKVTGIFDFIPDEQSWPYLQIGEADFSDWGTQDSSGFSFTVTVNTWHRPSARGRAPVRDIQADIYRVLHGIDLGIAGTSTLVSRFDFGTVLVEDDGVTYHGIDRFRFILGGN